MPGWRSEADAALRVVLVTLFSEEKIAAVVAAEDQHENAGAIASAENVCKTCNCRAMPLLFNDGFS